MKISKLFKSRSVPPAVGCGSTSFRDLGIWDTTYWKVLKGMGMGIMTVAIICIIFSAITFVAGLLGATEETSKTVGAVAIAFAIMGGIWALVKADC